MDDDLQEIVDLLNLLLALFFEKDQYKNSIQIRKKIWVLQKKIRKKKRMKETIKEVKESHPDKIFLSVKDLTIRYGVSKQTIWRWIATIDFPSPIKFSEGCTRWNLKDLKKWEQIKIEECQQN
jgi:prophage regulatory protein